MDSGLQYVTSGGGGGGGELVLCLCNYILLLNLRGRFYICLYCHKLILVQVLGGGGGGGRGGGG